MPAKRAKIGRVEPQVWALSDGDHVVDLLGRKGAAGATAARPLLHEQIAQTTPIAIVSSRRAARPGAIIGGLSFALAQATLADGRKDGWADGHGDLPE